MSCCFHYLQTYIKYVFRRLRSCCHSQSSQRHRASQMRMKAARSAQNGPNEGISFWVTHRLGIINIGSLHFWWNNSALEQTTTLYCLRESLLLFHNFQTRLNCSESRFPLKLGRSGNQLIKTVHFWIPDFRTGDNLNKIKVFKSFSDYCCKSELNQLWVLI